MKSQFISKGSSNLGAGPDKAQLIQKRAYELYLNRGKTPGHELEDWLQAEKEISATKFNGKN